MYDRTRKTIISINRFERKKNIALAVHAFAKLRQDGLVSEQMFDEQLRVVIAGMVFVAVIIKYAHVSQYVWIH